VNLSPSFALGCSPDLPSFSLRAVPRSQLTPWVRVLISNYQHTPPVWGSDLFRHMGSCIFPPGPPPLHRTQTCLGDCVRRYFYLEITNAAAFCALAWHFVGFCLFFFFSVPQHFFVPSTLVGSNDALKTVFLNGP